MQVEPGDVGEKKGVPERNDRPRPNRVSQITDAVGSFGPEGEFFIVRGCRLD
jgi:hypothetical protein